MFLSWWRGLVRSAYPTKESRPIRRKVPRKFRSAMRVEQLEDRLVPTTGSANVFLNVGTVSTAVTVAANRSTVVPVFIDFDTISAGSVGGIGGGTFYVVYDPMVLSISETATTVGSDIKLGSLLSAQSAAYSLTPAAGFSPGVVAIGLNHTTTNYVNGSQVGHLIELDFHVVSSTAVGISTLLDFQGNYTDFSNNPRQSNIHDKGNFLYTITPGPTAYKGGLTQPGALSPTDFNPKDTDTTDASIQITTGTPLVAPTAVADTYSMAPNNSDYYSTMTVTGQAKGVLGNDTPAANGPMYAFLNMAGATSTPLGAQSSTIASASETGFVVTVTTAAANNFQPGEDVTIANVATSGYDGIFTVAAVLPNNQFTYTDLTLNLATDTSGGTASAIATTVYTAATANGTVWLSAADGSFAYSPAPDFSGTDTFTYTAVDAVSNQSSPSTTVTIYVGAVLYIPKTLKSSGIGDTVVVPVDILNPNPINSGGLANATIAINFDPTVFDPDNITISQGDVTTAAGWGQFTVNYKGNPPKSNLPDGQIIITTSDAGGPPPITSTTGGALAFITFNVLGLPTGATSIINLASATPQASQLAAAGSGNPAVLPLAFAAQDNTNFNTAPGGFDDGVVTFPVQTGTPTKTTLSAAIGGSSVATITYGTLITLTATVSPTSGTDVPTAGTVDFKDSSGGVDLGVVSAETSVGSNAIFTLVTTPNQLQVLTTDHTISAIYSPGDGFRGSVGKLLNFAVNPAPLTITAVANTKNFDGGTTAAALPTVSGLVGTATIINLGETYDTPGVGSGKSLSVLNVFTILDNNSGSDYQTFLVSATSGTINKAPLTITARPNTKTYDSTTTAAALPTVSGLFPGDTVTGLAEVYANANGGSSKTLSVSAFVVNDGNGGNNYAVTTLANTAGLINKASLTITAQQSTKTYDASTSGVIPPVAGALLGNDTITGLADVFTNPNVGTGKILSVSAYTISDGNGGNNYAVTTVTNTTGIITKAFLTITAVANTKNFDSTVTAAATPTVSGLKGSDSVTNLAEVYADPNLGSSKTLSVSAYTVNDGNSGNNYNVTTALNTAGVIVNGVAGTNTGITSSQSTIVYGTPVTFTITVTATSGASSPTGTVEVFENGVDLGPATPQSSNGQTTTWIFITVPKNLNASGGGAIVITATFNPTGTFTGSTGTLAGGQTVTPKPLTITAATNTKTYDSTTTAGATPTVSGLVTGDTVTGMTEVYVGSAAGSNKTLSVSAFTVNDGNSGKNYTVTTVANSTGLINKAPLTITATTSTKTYDSTTNAAGAPTVAGLIGNDTVTGLTEVFNNANAGTGKTLGVYTGTTASATLTGLNEPAALAFDGSGNLFVANAGNGTVSEFAPGGTTPFATLTGLTNPAALAFDGSSHLFVANSGNATVSEFAPGATTPFATLTGLSDPVALAFDGSGNLFVANGTGNTVLKFAPGATTPSATLTGLSNPNALAFDGSGNLFVTNDNSLVNTVSKFTPGATTPSATLTGVSDPQALPFDGSGNLYVSNEGGTTVTKFAPGATTPSATLTGVNNPDGLAVNSSGSLFVANFIGNTVSVFTPGTTTPSATLTGLNAPIALAFGGSNLYVANFLGNTVSKFGPGYVVNDGNGGNNYAVTTVANTTGVTNKAPLTITTTTNTKTYDSTTTAAASPTVSGLIGKDTVTGLAEVYNDANAGTSKTLSVSAYTVNDGDSGNNYTVTLATNTMGTWNPAGSMATGRFQQTATLLNNGMVLVTGGGIVNGGAFTASAELYNPISNTWSSAGSMSTVRYGQMATLLNNGNVLVTGGENTPGGPLSSAELYNPVSNSWSSAASMSQARFVPTATLLGNGKVLVAGGSNNGGVSGDLSSAELYDPTSNTWSSAGSMSTAREDARATLLVNGKVLVTGGTDSNGNPITNAELYNPVSNTWSPAASSLIDPTRVTLLSNGMVLGVGGGSGNNAVLYDPVSNTWSFAAPMATAGNVGSAVLLGNGLVLVTGGGNSSGILSTAELYNPASNTWVTAGSMASARTEQSATLLGNGMVLIAGGINMPAPSPALSTAELYDPAYLSNPGSGGVITKAPLTISATTNTKPFDGSTTAAATPSVSGLQGGDTVTGLSETYDNSNPGTGKTLTVNTGYTVNDGNGGNNYTLATATNTTGAIVGSVSSGVALSTTQASVVYGTSVTFTITVTAAGGTLSPTGSVEVFDNTSHDLGPATFQNSNGLVSTWTLATLAKTLNVTVPAAHIITANFTPVGAFASGTGTLNGGQTVTPQPLTLMATANIKTYDSTTAAAATPTISSGLVTGDTVTNLTEAYASAIAGTAKTETVAGYTVNDNNSGKNYAVTTVANTTGVISKAALTIAAQTNTKDFDGSTTAGATPTVSGLQGSDTVTGLSESYDNSNPGTGKTLTVNTGYTVNDGNGGNNYTLATVTNTTGAIVGSVSSTTTLSSTQTSVVYGTPVTITITVTANGGTLSPTGTVEVFDSTGHDLGPATFQSSSGQVSTWIFITLPKTFKVGGGSANTLSGTFTASGAFGNSSGSLTTGQTVTPRALTLTATANTKTYDSTTAATATPTISSGLVSGDTVTNLIEAYTSASAGTGKTETVTGYTVNDGNNGNNYTVTTTSNTTGVITRASLTITATANTKAYDGGTTAGATPTVSGLQGNDSATGLTEVYVNAGVGTGKTLSVSGFSVTDGNGGNNYTVTTNTSNAGVITQAAITITATANTKTYDGTTSAGAAPTVSGLISGDTVTGLSESYGDAKAGTGKTLNVNSGYIVHDGNGGNNYAVTLVASTAGVINQATITITAKTNAKPYDGSTSASAAPTVTGLISGDSVTGLSESYDNANAGTSKTLNANSGYTINDGNGGHNYAVVLVPNNTGIITKAAITITALTNTKAYDGTTTAGAAPTITGLVGSDTVTNLTESYNNAKVGTGKALSVNPGYTINDGNGGNNYTIALASNATGVINKASITIIASPNSKTYDSTTSAAAIPTVAGLLSGDSVVGLSESYTDINAGSGKTLSVNPGFTVNDGNNGNNYVVSLATNTAGVIFQATLVITVAPNTKNYDGNLSAAAIPTVSGLRGGDKVTGQAEVYTDSNAGTGKTLSVSAFTVQDGNNGNNYTVTPVSQNTGVINPPASNLTLNNPNPNGSVIEPPQGSTFVYNLTVSTTQPLDFTVAYQTVNGPAQPGQNIGSATGGTDFIAVTSAVVHVNNAPSHAQRQTSAVIPITILGAAPQLPGGVTVKTFTVKLNFSVSNGSGNAVPQNETESTTVNIQQIFAPTITVPASQGNVNSQTGAYVMLASTYTAANINPAFTIAQYAQAQGDVYLNYSSTLSGAANPYNSANVKIPYANFEAPSANFTIPNYKLPSNKSGSLTLKLAAVTSGAAIGSPASGTVNFTNPQLAAGQPTGAPGGVVLSSVSQISGIISTAESQWVAAGANPASFKNVQFQVGNIGQGVLGTTAGNVITIDAGAEGFGWYLGTDNSAFQPAANSTDLFALPGSPAAGHMDLLTVVEHELGHVLGYADISAGSAPDSLMTISLPAGMRRAPASPSVIALMPPANVNSLQSTNVWLPTTSLDPASTLLAGGSPPIKAKVSGYASILNQYFADAEADSLTMGALNQVFAVLGSKKSKK